MLTVRLSSLVEEELLEYCQRKSLSKSLVVKEALVQYMAQKRNTANPYEVGMDLFGQEGSGVTNNSSKYKERVKSKINEKHAH